MELEKRINEDIKQAMLSKNKERLSALRAIKSALLLEKTGKDRNTAEIPESVEMQLLQKQVKQRLESAETYEQQGREELAKEERYQAEIIQEYLPKPMSEEELKEEIKKIIQETGASSMKDMGKVMSQASGKLAGKADNKKISMIVKEMLQ
ncbi:MAG: GatB/YqeY domain-containing protein [Bacteroidota bacterium]